MNSTELVTRVMGGKKADRVPTFGYPAMNVVREVLGKPLLSEEFQMTNPVSRFFLDRFGELITKYMITPTYVANVEATIKACVKLGYDSVWAFYDQNNIILDSKTIARVSGQYMDVVSDGHGNITGMYKGPGLTSREAFDEWRYWPDADDQAHRTYKFFKKMVAKYGDEICIMGQCSMGCFECMQLSMGLQHLAVWLRKEKDLIERHFQVISTLIEKNAIAMLDAGVPVIFQGDDLAFKSGPMINPKTINAYFGDFYTRLGKLIHDRGAKYAFHSCGDNTKFFDSFVRWGVDGVHALENTSNLDVDLLKTTHGDRLTLIGGMGIDYLLTERSTGEEVVAGTRDLINRLGPGGRFMIGPVHIQTDKCRTMVEAANRYGTYPLSEKKAG